MKKLTLTIILIIFCIYPAFADENIYSWTDDKGIRHFTNQKPHHDIEYDKTKAIPISPESEKIRPDYTAMEEEAKNLVIQNELEMKEDKIRRAEEEKQKAEKETLERKIAELSDKIKNIEDRPIVNYPVYPNFGRGHKQGHQRNAHSPKNRHNELHNEADQKEPRE